MNEKTKINPNEFSKIFLLISIAYVAALLISNTVATKIIMVGSLSVAAGIICFPVTYIITDVITEVYGYRRAKFLIWGGFGALAFMSTAYAMASWLTPAPFYGSEAAFDTIFQQVPRIALGSLGGYLVGSFLNSIVMSKMKVWTAGKHLWARTIGSTIVGEAADSAVFAIIAFAGTFAMSQVVLIAFSGFLLKSAYEIAATPLTYWVIGKIKKAEGVDVYDHNASYGIL
jgi:hypothetical protein